MNESENLYEPTVNPPPLPAESGPKKPWGFWMTLVLGLIVFVGTQVAGVFGLGAYLLWDQSPITELREGEIDLEFFLNDLILDGDVIGMMGFFMILAAVPLSWLVGQIRAGFTGWEYLGNKSVRWTQWVFWSVVMGLMMIGFTLLAPSLGINEVDDSMLTMAKSTDYAWLLFVGVGIAAPLVEELIFRGVFFTGWRASRLGLWGTIILTSAGWAALHVQYELVVILYLFLVGIVFGIARARTGSVWVPIWMHAINNGVATYEMLKL